MMPKIKYWQTLETLEKGWITKDPISGGTYQHYEKEIEEFTDLHKDVLIQEIVDNKYAICGDSHQHLAIPIFKGGYVLLSMRKWQEIMEEAYKICNPDSNEVPNFYMACLCNVKENLPKTTTVHYYV